MGAVLFLRGAFQDFSMLSQKQIWLKSFLLKKSLQDCPSYHYRYNKLSAYKIIESGSIFDHNRNASVNLKIDSNTNLHNNEAGLKIDKRSISKKVIKWEKKKWKIYLTLESNT